MKQSALAYVLGGLAASVVVLGVLRTGYAGRRPVVEAVVEAGGPRAPAARAQLTIGFLPVT